MKQLKQDHHNIMIIDDQLENLQLLAMMLTRQGYHVQTVTCGLEALQIIQVSPPDLILLDIVLPNISGYEVCELLKADEQTRNIPIVFLSGLNNSENKVKAFSVGGVDYLSKPFYVEEVIARMQTHLALRTAQKQLEAKNQQLNLKVIQHKHAEETIRQQNEFLTNIMNLPEHPFYILDANEYTIQIASDTFEQDIPPDTTCYALTHNRSTPCDDADHPCPIDIIKRTKKPTKVEHTHFDTSGKERNIEVHAHPIFDSEGNVSEIIEYWLDITERIQAEETLQNLNKMLEDEVAKRTHALQTEITERIQAEEALREQSEKLRALTTRLAQVEEVERQQLARELHDQAGQNLTALSINLKILNDQISAAIPQPQITEQLSTRLDDAENLVKEITKRIRNVMDNLRPPALEEYGLLAALRWYGAEFSGRTNINVLIQEPEPTVRLPATVETALFRITQEALNNVVRHAQASQVKVQVEVTEKTAQMRIIDNGIGFDSFQLTTDGRQRWGLLTMAERSEAIGGVFQVDSREGQGTKITVEVSL